MAAISFLVMHIIPAFFEQTTFPHISFVQCTFAIYINNLPVNFRRPINSSV